MLKFKDKFEIDIIEEDLKALNIKNIQKDFELLDEWGFDFERNILSYIHRMAETMRYCLKEKE